MCSIASSPVSSGDKISSRLSSSSSGAGVSVFVRFSISPSISQSLQTVFGEAVKMVSPLISSMRSIR